MLHSKIFERKLKKQMGKRVFKNGPRKICGRQPLRNLKRYGVLRQTISLQIFKGCFLQILLGPFLNTWTQIVSYIDKYLSLCLCGYRKAYCTQPVREKCPNTKFFWFLFSCISTNTRIL